MHLLRFGVGASLWAVALYGGLQLNRLDLGHRICGPWGCGPPASALLAVHVGWLLAILPLAVLLPRCVPSWPWRTIGLAVLGLAIITVVAVGIADHLRWRELAGDRAMEFAWQRFLFRIATLHGIPMVQLCLLGAVIAGWPRRETDAKTSDAAVEHSSRPKTV